MHRGRRTPFVVEIAGDYFVPEAHVDLTMASASRGDFPVRFRDEVIASYLDDEWRTPPAVHRLLGDRGSVADIACALERLARAGKIENKHEAVMAPKFRDKSGPPVLCTDFYRKLQRR